MHFLAQTTPKTTRRQIQACTFFLKPLSRPLVTKYKHALSQDHSSPNRSVHFLPLTTLKTTLRQIQACTFLLKPLPRLPVAKYKHALSFSNHSQDHSSPNPSVHFLAQTTLWCEDHHNEMGNRSGRRQVDMSVRRQRVSTR